MKSEGGKRFGEEWSEGGSMLRNKGLAQGLSKVSLFKTPRDLEVKCSKHPVWDELQGSVSPNLKNVETAHFQDYLGDFKSMLVHFLLNAKYEAKASKQIANLSIKTFETHKFYNLLIHLFNLRTKSQCENDYLHLYFTKSYELELFHRLASCLAMVS